MEEIRVAYVGTKISNIPGSEYQYFGIGRDIEHGIRNLVNTIQEVLVGMYGKSVTYLGGGKSQFDTTALGYCLDISKFRESHASVSAIISTRYRSISRNNDWGPEFERIAKESNNMLFVDEIEAYDVKPVKRGAYDYRKSVMRDRYIVDNSDILVYLKVGKESLVKSESIAIKRYAEEKIDIISVDFTNKEFVLSCSEDSKFKEELSTIIQEIEKGDIWK